MDRDAFAARLAARLKKVRGKPIDQIPQGDYCYESHIPGGEDNDPELAACLKDGETLNAAYFVLWVEKHKERNCPYWEATDYGTVKCHYLEEEALGLDEEDYEKALAQFGSEEELARNCTDNFCLADACRSCRLVLEALEAERRRESSEN
ncbi:MAG TPA: hypothetical protein PLS90_01855 [Candidatus Sumerlaeota bacterium]|nr:hypothetical protein [Candidatus Sumerlaeota bacterium]